jgi:hypothetical protein
MSLPCFDEQASPFCHRHSGSEASLQESLKPNRDPTVLAPLGQCIPVDHSELCYDFFESDVCPCSIPVINGGHHSLKGGNYAIFQIISDVSKSFRLPAALLPSLGQSKTFTYIPYQQKFYEKIISMLHSFSQRGVSLELTDKDENILRKIKEHLKKGSYIIVKHAIARQLERRSNLPALLGIVKK